LTEHQEKRKPFLAPFRSTDDERYVPNIVRQLVQGLLCMYFVN